VTSAPSSLVFASFDHAADPLASLQEVPQGQFLRWYLADLGAQSVLIEEKYFDRDYLSEFAAFYCTSSAGYPNVCQRLHYFSIAVDRPMFERAVADDEDALRKIQDAYLGFIVRRPIPGTPFGRTVLRWYPEQSPDLPRVIEPARFYTSHVAGLELGVRGLAWQQQDDGVGKCATIALWSMLHSSAFDDRHVVPTTAEITQTAHRAGLSAAPLFPSSGLTAAQLIASLRDSGFTPLVVAGELPDNRFGRERFSSSLASLIRSGYPVVVAGASERDGVGHAACMVGFRQAASNTPNPGMVELEDAKTEFVYIHDDNLGPAARFRIELDAKGTYVALRAVPPTGKHTGTLPDPTKNYPRLIPKLLLAAAHQDVRITPDRLHTLGVNLGTMIVATTGNGLGLSCSSRMIRLAAYVGPELGRILADRPSVLGTTRLSLWESVPPMSLHLGVIRFGAGKVPLLDVLYDTTDSAPNMRAFCYVAYHPEMVAAVERLVVLRLFDDQVVSVRAF